MKFDSLCVGVLMLAISYVSFACERSEPNCNSQPDLMLLQTKLHTEQLLEAEEASKWQIASGHSSEFWNWTSFRLICCSCVFAAAAVAMSKLYPASPANPVQERSPKYRADIDGLRGVAVMAVLAYHVNEKWLPGGWVGVDVFFVISGFVVTGSLIRREALCTWDGVAEFYTARAKRLLPNSFFTIVVTGFMVCLLVPKWDLGWSEPLSGIYESGSYAIIACANMHFGFLRKSYWDSGSSSLQMNPYTHMWSLGVEEQYYLVYPVILFLLYGQAPTVKSCQTFRIRSRAGLGVCVVVSFFSFQRTMVTSPEAAFYFLPFRFWELAAGGWLYTWQVSCEDRWIEEVWRRHPMLHIACEFLAIATIGGAMGLPTMPELTQVIRMSAGVLGAVSCIIANSGDQGNLKQVLSSNLWVGIGQMSYSIYLWHWPVLTMFRWTVGLDSIVCVASSVSITAMFALAAYHGVEKPMRHWPMSASKVLLVLLVGIVACQGSLFVLRRSHFTGVPPLCNIPNKLTSSSNPTWGRPSDRCASVLQHVPAPCAWRPPVAVPFFSGTEGIPNCFSVPADDWNISSTIERRMLIIGDSHALAAAAAFNSSRGVRELYNITLFNKDGGTFIGKKHDKSDEKYRERVFEEVRKLQANDVVVMAHFFLIREPDEDLFRRLHGAVVQKRNASLLIFGDSPHLKHDMSRCVPTWLAPNAASRCETSVEDQRDMQGSSATFAKKMTFELPKTYYFERWPLYCDGTKCDCFVPGTCTVAFADTSHLSLEGSVYSSPFVCSFMETHGLL